MLFIAIKSIIAKHIIYKRDMDHCSNQYSSWQPNSVIVFILLIFFHLTCGTNWHWLHETILIHLIKSNVQWAMFCSFIFHTKMDIEPSYLFMEHSSHVHKGKRRLSNYAFHSEAIFIMYHFDYISLVDFFFHFDGCISLNFSISFSVYIT